MNAKKGFRIYALLWLIGLAVFNAFVFLTPNEAAGMNKFGGAFWVGYIGITVAFLGQLLCAFFAFRADSAKKLFYNLPLLSISYTALVLTLIAGVVCMIIPDLPNWIGILVCLLILAVNAAAVIKAQAAAGLVQGTDEKVRETTSFIRELTVMAQNLENEAGTDELRREAKAVYEAIRYSDPVSDGGMADQEKQIAGQFAAFAEAVRAGDREMAQKTGKSLSALIDSRNRLCKARK